ncbi:Hsp20/alpha crystallin family protein [Agromyces sp. SYSU T00194]|uniref:Hsp20/alpha crystallin family protein n=1 Tax=Agromyces chitinivorans TaxID=3158560 RepID=UPI00339406EA
MKSDLARFDPFAGLESFGRDLFDGGMFRSMRGRAPSTDVYTTEDDRTLVLEAHLPGFAEDDISVTVDRGALVVQAERHETEEDKKKKYVVRESSTSFYRSLDLPDRADDQAISASFDQGVLTVTVPLTAAGGERKIAIGSGAAG